MFEIGYAIAANKRIWLIRDETYYDAKKEFEQLRLLTTIGYSPYVNSEQIIRSFFTENAHLTLTETIFTESIEPLLSPESGRARLIYLKSRHDTESSVRITRTLEDSQIPLTINDPKETTIQPLYWLWEAQGLVTHYLSHAREGFKIHNARYALVSGLARGLRINTLMLTEQSDMLSPIDYRDSLQYYTTQNEAALLTEAWLQPITKVHKQTSGVTASYAHTLRLATELKDFHLQLGDYIAENESAGLSDYFIETTVTMDLINGTQGVFVGPREPGKPQTSSMWSRLKLLTRKSRLSY